MSTVVTTGPDMAAMRARCQELQGKSGGGPEPAPERAAALKEDGVECGTGRHTSVRDKARQAVQRVDGAIAAHPKMAVAGAAIAGGLLARHANPLRWVRDMGSKLVSMAGGGALGGFAVHVGLHVIPNAVHSLAQAVAMAPNHVEGLLILAGIGVGGAIGKSVTDHRIARRDAAEEADRQARAAARARDKANGTPINTGKVVREVAKGAGLLAVGALLETYLTRDK